MGRNRFLGRIIYVIHNGLRDRNTHNVFQDHKIGRRNMRLRTRCLKRRLFRRLFQQQLSRMVNLRNFLFLPVLIHVANARIRQRVDLPHRCLHENQLRIIMRRLRLLGLATNGPYRRLDDRVNHLLVIQFSTRILVVTNYHRSLRLLRHVNRLATRQVGRSILATRLQLVLYRRLIRIASSVNVRSTTRATIKNGRRRNRFLRFAFRYGEQFRTRLHTRRVARRAIRPTFMKGRVFGNLLHLIRLKEHRRLRHQDGLRHTIS